MLGATAVTACDVNGDGKADLVVSSGSFVDALDALGTGAFSVMLQE